MIKFIEFIEGPKIKEWVMKIISKIFELARDYFSKKEGEELFNAALRELLKVRPNPQAVDEIIDQVNYHRPRRWLWGDKLRTMSYALSPRTNKSLRAIQLFHSPQATQGFTRSALTNLVGSRITRGLPPPHPTTDFVSGFVRD